MTRVADRDSPGRAVKAREGLALLPAVASLLILGLTAAAVQARPECPEPPGFDVGERIESRDLVVIYRTQPAIEVGRQFAVEAVVCAGPPAAIAGVRVDAYMPEHRHGMNYRPSVSARGEGLYVAEGLLFHMPGRWQLFFDVERGGKTERLQAEIELE